MGFLSQGVPNLVPWLIFRAWRGGRWDFRLWPFFRSVFRFWCPLQLLVFRFLSTRVFGKNKARYWFLCAVSLCRQMLSYFYVSILQSIRVKLQCGILDFCLRFTVACARLSVSVDERKKRTRSERSTRAAKTRSLSLPTSHAVFALFFDPFSFLEPGTG